MRRQPTPGAKAVLLVTTLVVTLGLIEQCQGAGTGPDTYSFDEEAYRVVEGANSTAVVYINRTGPHDVWNSSVVVVTSDGTAVAGTHYSATNTTVEFQLTTNQVAVSIEIINNERVEEDFVTCFTLSLMSPDPSSGILGGDTQVCINDDDNFFQGTCPPPEAVIEPNGEAVIEASVNSGSGTVAISWTDPRPQTAVQDVYRCLPVGVPPTNECDNGGEFPITVNLQGFNGRIQVEYSAFTQIVPDPVFYDCIFYLRVLDGEDPVIVCPENVTVSTDPGLPTGNVSWPEATVSDNSIVPVSLTANATSGAPFDIGDTIVEFVATDDSGNTATCTFTVTVTDDEDPVLVDCRNLTFFTSPGLPTAYVTYSIPNATDNSGDEVNVTCFGAEYDGQMLGIGVHMVECVAEDRAGLTDSCRFFITVGDDVDPVLGDCRNLTFSTSPGLPTADVTYSLPNATDNSDEVNVTCFGVEYDGQVLGIGVHMVDCVAEDGAGSTDSCQFFITVEDQENPNITCPADVMNGTEAGLATGVAFWERATVTDNSMVPITPVANETSGSSFDIGTHTVQFNAMDESGNSESCTFTVTIEDDEDPVLVDCRNLTFSTSPGLPSAYVTYSIPNATDNSGDVMHVNCFHVNHNGQMLGIGVHMVDCVAEDRAGLAGSCRFFITVEDQENPNITCPSDVMNGTEAGLATGVAFWELATVTDNSMVPITPVANETSGSSFEIGTHTVQFNAMDESGNSESCTFTVTIEDDEDPVLVDCRNLTFSTSSGLSTAYVTYSIPNATDNSGDEVMNVTCFGVEYDGQVLGVGMHMVDCVAEDRAGLAGSCRFFITVEDQEDPNITCPSDVMNGTEAGLATGVVFWELATVTDNSMVLITPVANETSGSSFVIGTHTVQFSAMDESGNSESCTFTVTIEDDEDPVLVDCRNLTFSTSPGLQTAYVTYSIPNATDNSGDEVNVTCFGVEYDGQMLGFGMHVVDCVAEDRAGLTDSCRFFITVEDQENPNITCPSDVMNGTEAGLATGVAFWELATVTDNSMVPITPVANETSGSAFEIGTHTVQFSATDESENSESCTFTVTIEDDEDPVLVDCRNLTFSTSPGLPSAYVTYSIPNATDNSGDVMHVNCFYVDHNGEVLGIGVHMVDCVAEDRAGLAGSCRFFIIVEDQENPNITCPSDVMNGTEAGLATGVAFWELATVTDNSMMPISTPVANETSGSSFDIGTHTVLFNATDESGNSANCTFTITIEDDEDPELVDCQNLTFFTSPRSPTAYVTYSLPNATDNSDDVNVTCFGVEYDGQMLGIGMHMVDCVAEDRAGLADSCRFFIIVEDQENPNITCPSDVMNGTEVGSATGVAFWELATVTDNSMVPITPVANETSGSSFEIGTHTVQFSATDESGNSANCTFTVTIEDDEDPVLVDCRNLTFSTSPSLQTAYVTYSIPNATDNSGDEVMNVTCFGVEYDGQVLDIGVHMVNCVAEDRAGLAGSCRFFITVEDQENPNITCPSDVMNGTEAGLATGVAFWELATVTDNSMMLITPVANETPGSSFDIGTHTVQFNATDESGNTESCTFTVTIEDDEDPVLVDCRNLTFSTSPGLPTAYVTYSIPSATDNSGDEVNVTCFGVEHDGEVLGIGMHVVDCVAEDRAGLRDSCRFVITVEDQENPNITCPSDVMNGTEAGLATGVVFWELATVTDNSMVPITPVANKTSGSSFEIGNHTVEFSATDESGNNESCTFTVTIEDNELPNITCPDNRTVYTDDGQNFATFPLPSESSSEDNSRLPVTITIAVNGTTYSIGQSVRLDLADSPHFLQYTATDRSSNVATCDVYVTVIDNEAPVIECPMSMEVGTDRGQNFANVTWYMPNVTDNSDEAIMPTLSQDSGTIFPLGKTTVYVEAMDPSGNEGTCDFNITVLDDQPPTFIGCPTQGVTNDTSPRSDRGVAYWPEPQGTDNVGVSSEGSNYQPGDTFLLGSTVVTYNVSDAAGFVEECSFTVLIQDNEAPVLECPEAITVNVFTHQGGTFVNYPRVNATDYASGLDTQMCTIDSGAFFPIGVNNITCTAVDMAQNMKSCIFQVIVDGSPDTEPPAISDCPMNITQQADSARTIVSWTPPTFTDNSGDSVTSDVTSDPGSTFGVGVTIVTYTATDAAGLVSNCTFFVIIFDDEPPTITNCPGSFTLTVELATDQIVADWTLPTASDNSGMVDLSTTFNPGQSLPPGVYPVTYTAQDPADLTAECDFTVTIVATGSGCRNNPCMNGGTCNPILANNAFTCECPSTLTGGTCEEDVDDCPLPAVSQECLDRGLICINQLDGNTCDCPLGFFRAGNTDICIRGKVFRITIVIFEIFGVDVIFSAAFTNPISVEFLTHRERLQVLFVLVFRPLPGFARVSVMFFSAGSIRVDAAVTFDANSPVTEADVDNALQASITTGDLLLGSEYKLSPSESVVIEEVCVDDYCLNGGTCTPNAVYLSSCICPTGYIGERCETMIGATTEPPVVEGGLSTEVIILIAVGSAVALLLILLILGCMCYLMRGSDRQSRGYLYREEFKSYRVPKRNPNGSVYDVQFQPRDDYGFRSPAAPFSMPYVVTGNEAGIPLHQLKNRGDADYY